MSHRVATKKVRLNADCLKLALNWLLAGFEGAAIRFRSDCTWTPRLLVTTSLLWAWADESTVVERFETARRTATYLYGGSPAGSYQGFLKRLVRWTAELCELFKSALRRRMLDDLGDRRLTEGFCVFGVDGSRIDLPRTLSNQAAYAAARKKKTQARRRRSCAGVKKAQAPQLWLTTLWHVGTGLPWDWRRGPSDSSERRHLIQMLPDLPAAALIAGDAGFTGYEHLQAVLESGRRILVRVGANVRLLRELGYARQRGDTVSLWPAQAARRRQPPLTLRLVPCHDGKHPIYLVTDLSPRELNDRRLVALYARRWGVELFYRSLKQTFGRRKLRSASAAAAVVELDWSMAGLWAVGLYALVQARRDDTPPERISCAQTLRCLRRTLRDYLHPCPPERQLARRLRSALIDDYVRGPKHSRDYPRKKQEPPPGAPRILRATAAQKRLARLIRSDSVKYG